MPHPNDKIWLLRRSSLVVFTLLALSAQKTVLAQANLSSAVPATAAVPSATSAEPRPYPQGISTILEDAGRVVTMLAVIGGGVWVYFNFLRGRTYRPRLELSVAGVTTARSGQAFVTMTATLRNVGLSRVAIKPEGTAYTVSLLSITSSSQEAIFSEDWKIQNVSRAFPDHGWIEPGETILEQRLVFLQNTEVAAFLITARVVGVKGSEWNATTILLQNPIPPITSV